MRSIVNDSSSSYSRISSRQRAGNDKEGKLNANNGDQNSLERLLTETVMRQEGDI